MSQPSISGAQAGLPQQSAMTRPALVSLGQAMRRGPALPPFWFAAVSMLAFVTLLLSFNHVVRQGVQTAELRRQTAATQSAALWRCQALQNQHTRNDCLATMAGASRTSAATDVAAVYASF